MTDKLKPCPFCGGEAHARQMMIWDDRGIHTDDDGKWTVECEHWGCMAECGCSFYTIEAEAIEAWNTRAERTCRNANTDGYRFRFECCECGYATLVYNCAARLDELPKYCPNCGARRVDE